MIELRDKRLHRRADLGMIVNPADRAIDLAFDRNFHLEAVSMHLPALVPFRRRGKSLGSLEGKVFR